MPRRNSLTLPACSGKQTAFTAIPQSRPLIGANPVRKEAAYLSENGQQLSYRRHGRYGGADRRPTCRKAAFMQGADFTPEISRLLDSKKVSTTTRLSLQWSLRSRPCCAAGKRAQYPYPCRGASFNGLRRAAYL